MKLNNLILILLMHSLILLQFNCSNDSSKNQDEMKSDKVLQARKDLHSFAVPEKAKTKHLSLDLLADFDKKILKGSAAFDIENNDAEEIIFDIRNLNIEKVTIGESESETTFSIGEEKEFMGKPLRVKIKSNTKRVKIYYSTNPDAAAVDWLSPQQTADKKHPFLFTQGQAILTRTWIPCQDSPGIRITYNAKLKVPKDLMAVMSRFLLI